VGLRKRKKQIYHLPGVLIFDSVEAELNLDLSCNSRLLGSSKLLEQGEYDWKMGRDLLEKGNQYAVFTFLVS